MQKREDIWRAQTLAAIVNGYTKKRYTYKDFMPKENKQQTPDEMLEVMLRTFNLEDPRRKG